VPRRDRAGDAPSRRLRLVAAAGVGLVTAGAALALTHRVPATPVGVLAPDDSPIGAPSAPDVQPSGAVPVASGTTKASDQARLRDALAARALPQVPEEAARPGPLTTRDPGPAIVVPPCPRVGPARVATGCPHTPAGALAQLAAIDQTAMQALSLPVTREVIGAWAAPGGPTAATWSGVTAMARLLEATTGQGAPVTATLVVTPAMGLVKGSVGADFVVVCVDFVFELTITRTSRVAVADCQRMVWQDGRWLIGSGPEPAPAPSVWPDTDAAISVGYRDLRHA
jgi:hypothetical protein